MTSTNQMLKVMGSLTPLKTDEGCTDSEVVLTEEGLPEKKPQLAPSPSMHNALNECLNPYLHKDNTPS